MAFCSFGIPNGQLQFSFQVGQRTGSAKQVLEKLNDW
jgi:hypothetical protein